MQKVFCVTHICTNHSPDYSTPKPKLVSFNAVGPGRADSMSKGTCHEGLTNTPELLAVRRDGDPAVGWPRCDVTGGTVPSAWHTHSGQAQRDFEEGTVGQGLGMTKIPLTDVIGTHKCHLTVYSYVNNFYVNFTSINTHTYACMHSHTHVQLHKASVSYFACWHLIGGDGDSRHPDLWQFGSSEGLKWPLTLPLNLVLPHHSPP